MQNPFRASVVGACSTLVLLMSLAGCGQKGPLFLPAANTGASAPAK